MTRVPARAAPRVAVVEDDPDLLESTLEFLQFHGYPAWGTGSAEGFYRQLAIDPVEVVVLDIGLPGEEGISVVRHLRGRAGVSVIVASARGALDDRLAGLRSGADRYLVKPVDLDELVANIEAVSRRTPDAAPLDSRTQAPPEAQGQASSRDHDPASLGLPGPVVGPWRLSRASWVLADPGGRRMPLTTREFAVLSMLVQAQGDTVRKSAIARALYGEHVRAAAERIDVVVARMRKKAATALGELPVKTVHGIGYAFTARALIE